MSELRQDGTSGRWVIVAPERGGRPGAQSGAGRPPEPRPSFDPDCPFCPGAERRLPGIIAETRRDAPPGWSVRAVPNKFPAVRLDAARDAETAGPRRARPGYGAHEVIIESPRHDADLPDMADAEIEDVVRAYRDRSAALMALPGVEVVLVFRNSGAGSGASLLHPHAQVVALDFTPAAVRERSAWSAARHQAGDGCTMCREIEIERAAGVRMIEETAAYVAFVPFAAEHPSEIWMAPKRHQASFLDLCDTGAPEFARLLRRTLGRLRAAHGDPPYNFMIDTASRVERDAPHVHWRLRIAPELAIWGGFELASGMAINPSSPEADARRLREAGGDEPGAR